MPSNQINYGQAIGGLAGSGAGIASGAVALSSTLSAAAPSALAAGAAIAGIGAAAVGLVLVLLKIFHGADPNEAIAANLQQIFEVATVNLEALAGGPVMGQWGSSAASPPLISKQELLTGIASFKQAAIQYEQQAAQQTLDPRPFQAGIEKITAELDNSAAGIAASYHETDVSGVINYTACHDHYVPSGYPGFMRAGQYGNPSIVDSIQAGAQVTDAYLKSLNRTLPNIVSDTAGTIAGAIADGMGKLLGGQQQTLVTPSGQVITSTAPSPTVAKLQTAIKDNPLTTVGILAVAVTVLKKFF